ncbi:MAG: ABC transporter permease subunit [Lutispora sp.]
MIPISIPDVLIAAIMQSFAIWLNKKDIYMFRVAGTGTLAHSFLPIIALSILPAFYIARITSLAVNDCYKKAYVLTALGKGCSSARILWNHVMRNAIRGIVEGLPSITSIIISNTLIVEYMFSYPGLTTSLMNHITMGDGRSSAIIIVFIGSFYFILNGLFHVVSAVVNKSNRREAI